MRRYDTGMSQTAQQGNRSSFEAVPTNRWLRLTSYGWDRPQQTIEARELIRRSRLASWIILGLLVMELLLLPAGLGDPATLAAVLFAAVGTVLAAVLNRAGRVALAGSLLVFLLWLAIMGAVISAPQGQLDTIYLPAYDLLVIAVIVAASILPRLAAFWVAGVNILLIIGDFYLQPIKPGGDLAFWLNFEGPVPILARPVAIQVIIATVAYLWVRGTDAAIRRADRAEEVATLEHAIADQKRQLDTGIQQILNTHVRAANGDFSARAPLGQENLLWQIAASLNNLLSRLQKAAQLEHQYRRTEEELRRLAAALDDAQAGRRPLWPALTGTPADMVIERLARSTRMAPPAEQQRYPSGMLPPGPPTPGAMPSGYSGPSGPSQASQASQWSQERWPSTERGGDPASNPWVFPPDRPE